MIDDKNYLPQNQQNGYVKERHVYIKYKTKELDIKQEGYLQEKGFAHAIGLSVSTNLGLGQKMQNYLIVYQCCQLSEASLSLFQQPVQQIS